jgi:hypothetical protein
MWRIYSNPDPHRAKAHRSGTTKRRSEDQGATLERGHYHSQEGKIWFNSCYIHGVQEVPKDVETVKEPFPNDLEERHDTSTMEICRVMLHSKQKRWKDHRAVPDNFSS